jgi:hypothetical protein
MSDGNDGQHVEGDLPSHFEQVYHAHNDLEEGKEGREKEGEGGGRGRREKEGEGGRRRREG